MADNNQVWAVSTPGAPHDAALARQAAYATTGGVTGIVASSGPGVRLTPGTPMSVRLDPCSVVAASTYAGARRESYSFDVPEAVDVAVDVTGSSSRTDVIAFVVTDPVLEAKDIMEIGEDGEPVEGSEGIDPRDHDYWSAVRFTSVPSSARKTPEAFRQWALSQPQVNGPVIPYAKVVQGANSTGLAGKVTPFFETVMGRKDSIIVDVGIDKDYTVRGPRTAYATLGPSVPFEVPHWATRARVKATVQGVRVQRDGAGTRNGQVSGLAFGRSMRGYRWYEDSDRVFGRQNMIVWADLPIASSRRGTTQDFQFRVTIEQSNAYIGLVYGSNMFLEVEFLEDPNAVDNSDPDLEG